MRAITFSSSVQMSHILILSKQRYHPFVVSERIALFLCWFLESVIAQFFVLCAWDMVNYTSDFLAGWQRDLFVIWIAIMLLFGVKKYLHYRDY